MEKVELSLFLQESPTRSHPRLLMSDGSNPYSLEARGIGKKYNQNWVLRDADLVLRPGQVLALLGENGAGKSTLVKILSGAERPDTGAVQMQGRLIPAGRPDLAKQAGFRIVYQEQSVCLDLSVEDNILLGQECTRGGGLLNRKQGRAQVAEVLARLGHSDLEPRRLARHLSVGQRQLIEIARALMSEARVLVLDEPTSSLARDDVQRLFQTAHRLASSGLSIIYISHFLEEVRQLCDSYLVLRDGRVAGQGTLKGTSESQIVELMVGRSVEELFPHTVHQPGQDSLSLQNLSGSVTPSGISLQVKRGEIFGVAGLVGAGRTEMLRVITGLDTQRDGQLKFEGRALDGSVGARLQAGLAMVSEDRKHEGLAQSMSIRDNITLSRLTPYSRLGWLKKRKQTDAARTLMQRLQINTKNPDQPVSTLSGGNQQKVAIARALHQDASCLLLDEPTRGVDVGTKAEIYRLIGEAAAEGRAVVFVSSYFRELLELCDRIAVLARGRLIEVREASAWTEHQLLMASMGVASETSED
jgi:ribose transport system ATP-binding protein